MADRLKLAGAATNRFDPSLLARPPRICDMHHAVNCDNIDDVRRLIRFAKIDLNSSIRSTTALSLSVYRGNVEIVRLLLEAGADPNKLSRDYYYRVEEPLFTACRQGKQQIAELLLQNGAKVDRCDAEGHTPLWVAARERRSDMCQLLLNYGADLNLADRALQTPLYLSSKFRGRESVAFMLIRHGANTDSCDKHRYGSIHWALTNGFFEIVKLLWRAGVSIDPRLRRWILEQRDEHCPEHEQMYDWVERQMRNAPTLRQLAVVSVRKQMARVARGSSILPLVERAPLPAFVKRELMLPN